MKNKKVLFITPFAPLSDSGDSFITASVLSGLKEVGCNVKVICFKKKGKKLPKLVKSIIWKYPDYSFLKKLSFLFSVQPLFVQKFFDLGMLDQILKTIHKEKIEKVIIYGYPMSQYGRFIRVKELIYLEDEDMNKIFSFRLSKESIFKKIFIFFEYLKSFIYQKQAFKNFSQIWLLSEKNKKSYFSNKPKRKIPFFVEFKKKTFLKRSKDIVFTGTLDWDENIKGLKWFLKDVWPNLLIKNQNLKLHIVGKGADSKLKKFISNQKNVFSYGFVEDLTTIYKKSAFAIAPIFMNAGVKVKILTYLQYGLPVISLKVATEGLFSKDGILIANQHNFSKKISNFLDDKDKRALYSKKAIRNIKENYSLKNLSKFLRKYLTIEK